jgi:late competence protein required for DNA uptake (superfamily II DNA/RNA helicase)
MICVRCSNESANVVAQAPDGSGAWEIIYCSKCNFSWRTSEEDQSIVPAKRDKMFQLEGSALDHLQVLVPIPPLRSKA